MELFKLSKAGVIVKVSLLNPVKEPLLIGCHFPLIFLCQTYVFSPAKVSLQFNCTVLPEHVVFEIG
jgi:Na+/H+ antiporter NhaA